ncbi:isovaleryl-CoA dehydrogenase [Afifella sp. H1R]|uniref:isovaleryl-CoA dehydrogenase n=1 Tax=Afifella sp. H1R TaxID=2908841 RepID=UPI001F38153D|nr:isovaleryl-CoA dehydrogenase [Afifella sp. H1R]MCF1502779.1 isovaleryl-CoA dehydrogenase [Afifella sp. H1R]
MTETMNPGRDATHAVFNQTPPRINLDLFQTDPLLDLMCAGFADPIRENLQQNGRFWGSGEAREFARLANSDLPELKRYDAWGRRINEVEFHPAYHALMRRSVASGLHCSVWERGGEEEPVRHRARAARLYMTAQAECGHICPMTMTNASIASLRHSPDLLSEWGPRLLSRTYDRASRNPAEKQGVTIGMGMTEKQGGTDVRQNRTHAEPTNQGFHRLTGHKWFMSAPMSDAFLVLAQTENGLSCFLMPRFLPDGTANTIRFERLKDKLGNRSNASSEAEFDGAHAWMVGEEGKGVRTIIEMVTYTRLDCAVASTGLMRAGLAEAVHHCRHRHVFGSELLDKPLMQRVLCDLTLDLAAAVALSFRLAEAFDLAADRPEEEAFARLMTPVAKYWICKSAQPFLAETMECLGGNGYVEESIMPRLVREAPVNAIWEGSGNVMALDVLRVLGRDPQILAMVLESFRQELGHNGRAAVDVLAAAAEVAMEDEGSARVLTEQLALTAAAAALRRDFPPVFADAFIETRLGRPWRSTYGMLDRRFNMRALLDYAFPEP